ncbi:TPM domain-containing protein [Candidatus Woesearchaeota archaeon]|nr:TPM domain-containing protein [Candidatus Woesearchaeota archaeon]MBW3021734.1 TPM domain-containing protein [Candidatus Woesearchaeota archaeon]
MKHIICIFTAILLVVSVVGAVSIDGFVNDYANIIDANSELEIEGIYRSLYNSGIAEVAVVTVNSLDGKDIESYSLELAQGKLGDKEKNNGLLLLVALEEREYRFEVGRGLEGDLNDAKVGRIGRMYLVDNFRAGDYGKGVLEASKAVASVLAGDVESEYYVTESSEDDTLWLVFYIVIFVLIFILPILAAILRHKKFKNKYFDAAAGAIILFGGRRGGGSGGFGGFGGFGGGSFGGGGAGGHF